MLKWNRWFLSKTAFSHYCIKICEPCLRTSTAFWAQIFFTVSLFLEILSTWYTWLACLSPWKLKLVFLFLAPFLVMLTYHDTFRFLLFQNFWKFGHRVFTSVIYKTKIFLRFLKTFFTVSKITCKSRQLINLILDWLTNLLKFTLLKSLQTTVILFEKIYSTRIL